jgi:4-amino-4-deoxy-L-arabinose transferase-like glycosyltransferase
MSHDTEWNIAHGNMPTPGQLRAARYTNVALALATAVVVLLIGRTVIGALGGLISGLGYALHPLVLSTSTRAWSDATLVFCLALAGLAAIRFGQRPSLARAALIGIALGFGASAKLSPLVLALLVAPFVAAPLVGLIASSWRWRGVPQVAVAFLIVPATAFATFVALYPHLWTDPIDHSKRMFDFREDSFSLQGAAFPNARVVDFPDGLRRIGVQLSDRFSLGQYIANLLHSKFNLPLSYWARELDLTLAIAGCLLLAAWLTAGRWPIERTLPLVVLVGQTVLIAATYQLDYSRYLLPAVPLLAIGIAASIALPVQYLLRLPCRRNQLGQSKGRASDAGSLRLDRPI